MNELGDGRELLAAPTMRAQRGYILQCSVAQSFPRIEAHRLGTDLALSEKTHDLVVEMHELRERSLTYRFQDIRERIIVDRPLPGQELQLRRRSALFFEHPERQRSLRLHARIPVAG